MLFQLTYGHDEYGDPVVLLGVFEAPDADMLQDALFDYHQYVQERLDSTGLLQGFNQWVKSTNYKVCRVCPETISIDGYDYPYMLLV